MTSLSVKIAVKHVLFYHVHVKPSNALRSNARSTYLKVVNSTKNFMMIVTARCSTRIFIRVSELYYLMMIGVF